MGKKIFLNTLYNIGIFICLMIGYWGFNNKRYEYIAVGVFIAIIFIVLKVKLIKEVRSTIKKAITYYKAKAPVIIGAFAL